LQCLFRSSSYGPNCGIALLPLCVSRILFSLQLSRVRCDVVAFDFNRKSLHGRSPFAAAAAVITFITSIRDTSKRIVREIWRGLFFHESVASGDR